MSEWRDRLARPDQLMPGTPGSLSDRNDWHTWKIRGGRSSGKSRAAAEAIRELVGEHDSLESSGPTRVALVSASLEEVRSDMIEGTLLGVLGSSVKKYNRDRVEIELESGAIISGYGADEPERLRGPFFHIAWADHPEHWPLANQALTLFAIGMTVRLVDDGMIWDPRTIITTEPEDEGVVTTRLG